MASVGINANGMFEILTSQVAFSVFACGDFESTLFGVANGLVTVAVDRSNRVTFVDSDAYHVVEAFDFLVNEVFVVFVHRKGTPFMAGNVRFLPIGAKKYRSQ